MNIFALEGHKVKCSSLKGGTLKDEEKANKHLILNEYYSVNYTDVHDDRTNVYLEGFELGLSFNSVFFTDVSIQSEEDDKEHDDYRLFSYLI